MGNLYFYRYHMKLIRSGGQDVGNLLTQSGDSGNPPYINNIFCPTKMILQSWIVHHMVVVFFKKIGVNSWSVECPINLRWDTSQVLLMYLIYILVLFRFFFFITLHYVCAEIKWGTEGEMQDEHIPTSTFTKRICRIGRRDGCFLSFLILPSLVNFLNMD